MQFYLTYVNVNSNRFILKVNYQLTSIVVFLYMNEIDVYTIFYNTILTYHCFRHLHQIIRFIQMKNVDLTFCNLQF